MGNDTDATSSAAASQDEELDRLRSYVTHRLLVHTIARNIALVDDLKNKMAEQSTPEALAKRNKYAMGRPVQPNDIAVIFERLLDNMAEFRDIQGHDADDAEQAAVEAAMLLYKGMRCYYVALSYNKAEKWTEAVGLFAHTGEYVPQIRSVVERLQESHGEAGMAALGGAVVGDILAHTAWLEEKARVGIAVPRAMALLSAAEATEDLQSGVETMALGDGNSKAKTGKWLMDNLGSYQGAGDEPPEIIAFPPEMQPVPVKPVLFDLAFDSFNFPDLSERKSKKGFFGGFFG